MKAGVSRKWFDNFSKKWIKVCKELKESDYDLSKISLVPDKGKAL